MSVKPNGASGEVRPWGEVTPVPAESRMPVWGAPAPTRRLPAFAAAPAINPFAQPTGSAEAPYPQPGTGYPSAAYPMAGAPAVSTESIASTGNGVCRLLWLLFLGRLITLIAGGYEHIVVGHYLENPVGTDVSGLATIDRIIRWTGYVELLVAVILAIRFCIWIYRATRNAVAFNPQIARVPPWLAVVLCLTPLVNFVAPYFVVSMALSAAETPLGTTRSRGSSMLLVSWWASVLAQVVLVVLSRRSNDDPAGLLRPPDARPRRLGTLARHDRSGHRGDQPRQRRARPAARDGSADAAGRSGASVLADGRVENGDRPGLRIDARSAAERQHTHRRAVPVVEVRHHR